MYTGLAICDISSKDVVSKNVGHSMQCDKPPDISFNIRSSLDIQIRIIFHSRDERRLFHPNGRPHAAVANQRER